MGAIIETVTLTSLSEHSLRVTDPDPSLCDSTVKQHAGFLDITNGKHLFFWFFESRIAPEKAPLTLWLNGGPGGSSSVGLLFELGPCTIADEGKNTTFNPYSWNTYSNMIFLDQPVNVGFSYSTDNSTVNNSPDSAEDVWAFLQLFMKKYPEYAALPFHIAAESYGGTYGPHIASAIHEKNKQLASGASLSNDVKSINLASLVIADGHTEPLTQFASVPDYICDGPYALLESNGTECEDWRKKVPTCERFVQTCYDFDTPMTCIPAREYCWTQVWERMRALKRNVYDIRQECDAAEESCYPQLEWIEAWYNTKSTKKRLGIDTSLSFKTINNDVGKAFHAHGDTVRNSARLLPDLLADGIRVLSYAGMTDMACNFIGVERWMEKLEQKFHDEFLNSETLPWTTVESRKQVGEVRYAGGGGLTAGNWTFVKVYEAGHMVPYDQPEAALDMVMASM
ncbi:hypothetical protein EIP86_002040 [Pleurotus ostreatoroseus]|nr:hypothetical protein EIP86_002040 [Pleurotus ostreatoroseus]